MSFRILPALYLWLCCLLYAGVQAQSPHIIDSLEQQLARAPDDTAKARIMQTLSDRLRLSLQDSAKAMRYAQTSLQLYQKHRHTFGMGMAHFYMGNLYLDYYNLEAAEQEYLLAEKILRNDSSYRGLGYRARIWRNYGAVQQRRDDNRQYLDILLNKSLPLLEKAGDTVTLGLCYREVGLVFMNFDENAKAREYFDKSLALQKNSPNQTLLAETYIYAARNLVFMKEFRSARSYLDKAISLPHAEMESPTGVLYYHVNGMYYYYLKEPEKALSSYDKGLALADKAHEYYNALDIWLGKFYIYDEQNNYPLARKTLNELYELTGRLPIPYNRSVLLDKMAALERKAGNPAKAYDLLRQHLVVYDSLQKAGTQVKLNELEKKYQDEKKQKEVLSLQNKAKQQQLVLERNRTYIILLLCGLLLMTLIVILILVIYRNKQRLAKQKELLHQQQLEQMKQEQRLTTFSAMLEGQEQERKRLARDLHDGLGGTMANIKLNVSRLTDPPMPATGMEKVEGIITQLDNATKELRQIARNMMPETLLKFGLETAIKDLCEGMQHPSNIVFQAYGLQRDIPQSDQIMIYRLVQELVTNAVRHAGADKILVQCIQREEELSITVEDDGKGFDPHTVNPESHMGLTNIRTRVAYLKGTLDIQSTPGTGTTVNIEVNV